jgi:nucleotide-binding universal stress UspA family protein
MSLLVSDGTDGTRALAESLLFESGGPVIAFPATETPAHIQSVVVAWDGGRAAARAVRDALPILGSAKRVGVLSVIDDKPVPAEGVAEVQRFLAFHGIESEHLERRRGDVPIGKFLEDTALSRDAGLMVMGAYGHTRLRELVLGGATRAVLEGVRLPTLLSH